MRRIFAVAIQYLAKVNKLDCLARYRSERILFAEILGRIFRASSTISLRPPPSFPSSSFPPPFFFQTFSSPLPPRPNHITRRIANRIINSGADFSLSCLVQQASYLSGNKNCYQDEGTFPDNQPLPSSFHIRNYHRENASSSRLKKTRLRLLDVDETLEGYTSSLCQPYRRAKEEIGTEIFGK